jgi:uncharacterized protein YcaQ
MWNRGLIESIFDFNYRWEVYKPKAQRQYGYYVLPVLYDDRFVARIDPAFDKKKRVLTVQNWWWEPEIQLNEKLYSALTECLHTFCHYLSTEKIILADHIKSDPTLEWMKNL